MEDRRRCPRCATPVSYHRTARRGWAPHSCRLTQAQVQAILNGDDTQVEIDSPGSPQRPTRRDQQATATDVA